MGAAGLFVGVGHQYDARIDALKFAARDATALWASIADLNDSHGDSVEHAILLKNADATIPLVRKGLEDLAAWSAHRQFDFLHIHFSCHGTPDGRLVLADARWGEHEVSTLSLAEITSRVSQIRATTAMVTFDSCFSGTVVGIEGSPNAEAFSELLGGIHTGTRAVAWAAGATEKAWESPRLSHGYLSFGLLSTLRDARMGRVTHLSVTQWLNSAVAFTARQSKSDGFPQHPRGRMDLTGTAEVQLPPDGPRQQRVRAELGITAVGPDPADLRQCGFNDAVIPLLRNRLAPRGEFNSLQLQAIAPGGLLAGRSIVVRAPTSAGKSVVGELGILAQLEQGRKAIVLSPMRALVHEQADRFAKFYRELGCRIVRSAGDAGEQDALLFGQHFDVAFITYEKFAALSAVRPSILVGVGCLVVDELQQISDPGRGAVVELILTRVMAHRRKIGQRLQVVGLCANVTDLNSLPEWLEAEPVGDGTRPVPLRESVLSATGRLLTRQEGSTAPLETRLSLQLAPAPPLERDYATRSRLAAGFVPKLTDQGEQVLVFCANKPAAMKLARQLGGLLGLESARAALTSLVQAQITPSDRSRAHAQLCEVLQHGVAFHIGDLERVERDVVEEAFRSGEIKVLVATTTLAMGVNTPARSVVIVDSQLPAVGGPRGIDVTTYRNMAGRAGRLGMVEEGDAYLLAESDTAARYLWEHYTIAPGDKIVSVLDQVSDEDLVLAVAAQLRRGSATDIVQAAQSTFMAYLKRTDSQWWNERRVRLHKAVESLAAAGFLVFAERPFYVLSEMGKVCGLMGLRKESADRLIPVIQSALRAGEPIDEGELVGLAQLTVELDGVIVPLKQGEENRWLELPNPWLDKRPVLRSALRDGVIERVAAGRLKRFAGIRMWLKGTPKQEIENEYDKGTAAPAFGAVKRVAERTADFIGPVAALVAAVQPDLRGGLRKVVKDLHWRLELGATGAAVGLLRLREGLSRHQASELVTHGIGDEDQLRLALEKEEPSVFGLLTTQVAQQLRRRLQGRKATVTAANQQRDQHIIDLLGTTDEL